MARQVTKSYIFLDTECIYRACKAILEKLELIANEFDLGDGYLSPTDTLGWLGVVTPHNIPNKKASMFTHTGSR